MAVDWKQVTITIPGARVLVDFDRHGDPRRFELVPDGKDSGWAHLKANSYWPVFMALWRSHGSPRVAPLASAR